MKTLISLLVWMAVACSESGSPHPAVPRTASTATTRWESVRASQGLTIATALAEVHGVAGARGADVTTTHAGRVHRLLVSPGDQLEAGDPVVEVSIPELAVAAAQLRGARDEEAILRARVDQLALLIDEGLVRADRLLDARTALTSTRSRRDTANATLRAASIDPSGASSLARRGYVVLRSPVDGVVLSVAGRVGSPVIPGTPIARIAGSGPVRIIARAPSALPDGDVLLGTDRGDVRLRQVGTTMRDTDGLWVAFFEPTEETTLRDGERWPLRIASDGTTSAVPASALSSRQGHAAQVIRRRGAETERIDVEVVHVDGARASVRGELAEGDRVAVDPAVVFEEAP